MSKPAIAFESVSKRFLWRQDRPRSLMELFLGAFRRQGGTRELWALRDFTLAVAPGEVVGVIGPNGAGKSTLLRIASGVIRPTSGHVAVRGRIGALLDLTAGFHPDLTGRENVFLTGALVGMRRQELERRFEEIAEFAGIGEFIDSPVRFYSSGMSMRLGFAVAACLAPEILLIDEVLAVGDQAFAHRCLERIQRLKSEGTAILLVTHDLQSVLRMCSVAVLMNQGRVVAAGPPEDVVSTYLESLATSVNLLPHELERRWGSGEVRITDVWVENGDGERCRALRAGSALVVGMRYKTKEPVPEAMFGLAIRDESGYLLTGPNTVFDGFDLPVLEGVGEVRYRVASPRLQPGRYYLSVSIYRRDLVHAYDHWEYCLAFDILQDASLPRCFGAISFGGAWELKLDERSRI